MAEKISKEEYLTRQRLWPIDIKENIRETLNLKISSNIYGLLEKDVSLRFLIDSTGERIFMEQGSNRGLLNLIDLHEFDYDLDNPSRGIIPFSILTHRAIYDSREDGDITRIYLRMEDALTAPYRRAEDGFIEKTGRDYNGKFWTVRLRLLNFQQTSCPSLKIEQQKQQ